MRRKNYKVGDRIFLEDIEGEVFDCVVEKVEPRTYEYNGRVTHFNMLYTGKHSCTEDYNCLAESNPKVKEYKRTHSDPRVFREKFKAFMEGNGFDIKSYSIQAYLYDLLS